MEQVLARLPPALDRSGAATLVDDLLPDNVPGAFAVAMIWGHGSSGYGPYRTARVLTAARKPRNQPLDQSVVDRLQQSIQIVQKSGAVEGYRFLNNHPGHIAGLGPAFFTKWLYFVTSRGDTAALDAAPVLDALVVRWLRDKAGIILRPGRTDDYRRYVTLLRDWGKERLTAAQVEERIFRLIRDDGA